MDAIVCENQISKFPGAIFRLLTFLYNRNVVSTPPVFENFNNIADIVRVVLPSMFQNGYKPWIFEEKVKGTV